MFTDKFMEVIGKEGVVSIVSCADNEAHVANTWNSYLRIPEDGKILLPAWAMRCAVVRSAAVLRRTTDLGDIGCNTARSRSVHDPMPSTSSRASDTR